MSKRIIQCIIGSLAILYFIIAASQSSTVAARQSTMRDGIRQGAATMAPVADFVPTKGEGNPPFQVQFLNHAQGNYTSSQWDFGDGQTSTETNPTHTYAITGTYTVKLTVSGPTGSNSVTKADLIKVHTFPAVHPDGWDLTFGDYGLLTVDICNAPLYATHKAQVQSDGKLLLAVQCSNSFEKIYQIYVRRYLTDGALDANFGQQGQIRLPDGYLGALDSLPDGKFIVISGLTLRRFYNDGALDSTFAVQGVADAFPGANTDSSFVQMILQSDGKLLVAGVKDKQPILARYDSNGFLDSTFNGQGYLLTVISSYNQTMPESDRWSALALQPDGRIVAGRTEYRNIDPFNQTYVAKVVVSRFLSNGLADPTFDNDGNFEQDGFIGRIGTQSTGRILIDVGNTLIRLLPTGSVDHSFTAPAGYDLQLIDPTDRILVIGGGAPNFSVTRLLSDGTLDQSFGNQGILLEPVFAMGIAALLQNGNQILLAVGLEASGYPRLGFIRYRDDHPTPTPLVQPLALLYAVLDNNLGDGWTRLVNNIEMGKRTGAIVRLLIDGPSDNDVYVYDIQQDNNPFCPNPTNPTCDGRYVEGMNFWRLINENSAHPDSLYQFLVEAMNAYPTANKITLSLIGHGSGWSANVLPGQPSIWRDQNDTVGGMLWDDHPATGQQESRSLSTKALGQALTWSGEQTGKFIDLLYLDGCSMGMAEVAYEVRNGARYLLASPNIDWASFNYHLLLPKVTDATGLALGERWLQIEASEFRANPGHPFTLTLLDLSQMNIVATATSALADSLQALLPAQQAQMLAAFTATDRFDSDYDGDLDSLDAYSDLPDFANQISQTLSNTAEIQQAVQTLRSALAMAVVAKDYAGGSPWLFSNQNWQWQHYGGLGIYLPLGQDEARRQLFYHTNNLAWTTDTTWDEFLAAFWAGQSSAATLLTAMPVCHNTAQGCQGLANPLPVQTPVLKFIFLPVTARK